MAVPQIVPVHPDPASSRAQQRAVREGRLIRVGNGAFVLREHWEVATEWERHIARAVAAQGGSPRTFVSHASAVVLHRLPWILPVPDRPTLTDPGRETAQRTRFVDKVAGAGRTPVLQMVEGVPVTGLVDTAVDVALRYDRARGVAVADAALRRGVDRAALLADFAGRTGVRAHRRARQVLEAASGLSESAGESVAHLVMIDAGCPDVVQQHPFHDASGFIGRVDFWFPDHGVVVEFDGLAKYRDPSLRNGRSAEQALIDEKLREDRLRAHRDVRHVVRPIWRDVMPGGRFPTMLAGAGLPVRRGLRATPAW